MSNLSDYQVIIPLGGEGKRLKPFTKDRSKAVVPLFNNVPITEINIYNISKELGIRNFILGVNGYQNYLDIQTYYQGGFGWSHKMGISPQVHFYYQNPNYNDEGGADSVLHNIKKLDIKEPIIVFQNDNIFSPNDLRSLIEFSEITKHDFVIGLSRVENPKQYGLVKLDADGKTVNCFIEKPNNNQSKNTLVNTGVYVVKPKAFNQLYKEFGWNVLPKLANEKRLGGFIFNNPWLDFGSAKLHQKSFQKILNRNFKYLLPTLKRTSKRIAGTNIWIRGRGPQSLQLNESIIDAIVGSKIKTKGNILIGRDCTIGNNVHLESCSIGDMTTLGSETEIIKSNIMDAWQIEKRLKIINSTLGRGGRVFENTMIKSSFIGDNVIIASNKIIKNKVITKNSRML